MSVCFKSFDISHGFSKTAALATCVNVFPMRNGLKATGEPRCVSMPFVRYGHPKKSAQMIFLQHFWEVVLVLLVLFSKKK